MSTPTLVEAFYESIWNRGDLAAVSNLLALDFSFRGSLGNELHGRDEFTGYVRSVRRALADYHCEIICCVVEGDQAFAKMLFSGRHIGEFRGYKPTQKIVQWQGAALFTFRDSAIVELWVLGDLAGLDALLKAHEANCRE